MDRVHVVIRLVLLAALGAIGCSSIYWLLYLALPALAAMRIAQRGPQAYLSEDAAQAERILRWLAAAYAYLWLLTDDLPSADGPTHVDFAIAAGGRPTPGSALLRLFSSLPSLVILAVASMVAFLFWLIGAVWILAAGRVPSAIHEFLESTLAFQFRLVAYHLSMIDRYPSFSDVALPDEGSFHER
jgi:hypothetical protein